MAPRKKFNKSVKLEDLEDPKNLWLDDIMNADHAAEGQFFYILPAIKAGQYFNDDAIKLDEWIKKAFSKHVGSVNGVQLLGSAVNGLALKDSEVDIFVGFGDLITDVEDAYVKIRNTLRKYKDFQDVFLLEDHEPVIQCIQVTGFVFNIFFKRTNGIYNSRLIQFLMNFDERIKNITLILKFWMKKQGLLGEGKMSGYAFTLLVVFYLQQQKDLQLPSVFYFQKCCKWEDVIQGWNVTLPKCVPRDGHFKNNNPSMLALLQQFFEFYANFDFESQMICPFVGKALPINTFDSLDLVPGEYACYEKNFPEAKFDNDGAIRLQDPIFHYENAAKMVTKELAGCFQKYCTVAAKIFQKENEKCLGNDNYQGTLLFHELFKPIQSHLGHQIVKAFKTGNYEKTIYKNNFNGKSSLCLEIFLTTQFSSLLDVELSNVIDLNVFFQFFRKFLTDIIKCDVRENSAKDRNSKIFHSKLRGNEVYCLNYRDSVRQQCKDPANSSLSKIAEKVKTACWKNSKCECNSKTDHAVQFEIIFLIEKKNHALCFFKCLDNEQEVQLLVKTFTCIEPLLLCAITWLNN